MIWPLFVNCWVPANDPRTGCTVRLHGPVNDRSKIRNKIRNDVDLGSKNTLGLPCIADYFCASADEDELAGAIAWARENKLPVLVLGEGSNLVLPARLNALVLQLTMTGYVVRSAEPDIVDVAAGNDWHQLVTELLAAGWYGLENLALIPGTVGAAPVQNIGAYGVEIERFVHSVRVFDMHTLRWLDMPRADCEFRYRHSIFRQHPQRFMITRVRLRLSRRMQVNDTYGALREELERRGIGQASATQVYDAVVHIRRQKLPDPRLEANVGSFFKNPVVSQLHYELLRQQYPGLVAYPQGADVKLAAGWLIEQAGFKGKSSNGVCMHPRQALVLVNQSGASASDVLAYADSVVAKVESLFGVVLQREPVLVSSDGFCSAA